MRTGTWLVVLAVGGMLAFAVRMNTSVFDFHVAGFVLIIIAIIALAIPQRGRTWLGRRMYVRRTRHLPDGEVEEGSYPPYVVQNPGTARGRLGLPGMTSIPTHADVAAYTNPKGNRQPGQDYRTSGPRVQGSGGPQSGSSRVYGGRHAATSSKDEDTPAPQQMEIIEDIYEE